MNFSSNFKLGVYVICMMIALIAGGKFLTDEAEDVAKRYCAIERDETYCKMYPDLQEAL